MHDKTICETWWSICGRKEELFDPLIKICSIHFEPGDLEVINVKREGKLIRQTILRDTDVIPTLYLKPEEYKKFERKRKRSMDDSYSEYSQS